MHNGRIYGMYKGEAVWHVQKGGYVACIRGGCGMYKWKAVWHV